MMGFLQLRIDTYSHINEICNVIGNIAAGWTADTRLPCRRLIIYNFLNAVLFMETILQWFFQSSAGPAS